jgi:hypothetical protein
MKTRLGKCIFCSVHGPFTRAEHPIPESLGNDDLTLPMGLVCDSCNQYFGTKLESTILNYPPWSIERVAAAVRTKRGRFAKFIGNGMSLWSTGFWSHVVFAADPTKNPTIRLNPDGTGVMFVVPPPDYHFLLSRFLLKVGLELLALSDTNDINDHQFDPARRHARFGEPSLDWEVAYGIYPRRRDLIISTREDEIGPIEERQLYSYELGVMEDGRIIFAFMYITHLFAICLTSDRLGNYIAAFNAGNEFHLQSSRR